MAICTWRSPIFTIRKISPDGIVSAFVGAPNLIHVDPTGCGSYQLAATPRTAAWLFQFAICNYHRCSGNLYVADSLNRAIRKATLKV